MILITKKIGNIYSAYIHHRDIDVLSVEWYETRKRILHKLTKQGKAITIKFLNENPNLKDGDILFEDDTTTIAVEINPCECIVLNPHDIAETASMCYEIGNRHLPLFYEGNELLIPYDIPLFNLLETTGNSIKVEQRKLNHSYKTTVLPHLQVGMGDSLLNKINGFTTSF